MQFIFLLKHILSSIKYIKICHLIISRYLNFYIIICPNILQVNIYSKSLQKFFFFTFEKKRKYVQKYIYNIGRCLNFFHINFLVYRDITPFAFSFSFSCFVFFHFFFVLIQRLKQTASQKYGFLFSFSFVFVFFFFKICIGAQ